MNTDPPDESRPQAALGLFLDHYMNHVPELLAHLMKFLEARPDWMRPRDIKDIKRYEDRLAFSKDIADTLHKAEVLRDENWQMDMAAFATLMLGPIGELRILQCISTNVELAARLQAIQPAVLYCMFLYLSCMLQFG